MTNKTVKPGLENKDKEMKEVKVAVDNQNALSKAVMESGLGEQMNESAELGGQTLMGSLPLLKVQLTGRSKNQLEDGTEPKNGNFFFQKSKRETKTITCNILAISRGFRTKPYKEKSKPPYFQVVAGITDDGEPFFMYVSPLKFKNERWGGVKGDGLWDFGKKMSQYTKARPQAIPMFAITVMLETKQVEIEGDKFWVIDWHIPLNQAGVPNIVSDVGKFVHLREMAKSAVETLRSLVASQTCKEGVDTFVGALPVDDIPH